MNDTTTKSADELVKARLEILHKDISLANTYRLELTKLLLAVTTALFAFTVSFRPTLKAPPEMECLLWAGWFGLAASLIGGVFELYGWERFYISYRDHDYKAWREELDRKVSAEQISPVAALSKDAIDSPPTRRDGKAVRREITGWRRLARTVQFFGFFIGVAAIALFSAANIANVAPKP